MSSASLLLPADAAAAEHLLRTVLEVSPTGALLLAPVTDATGAVVDFGYVYVNAVARRQLYFADVPAPTVLGNYPQARETGVLAFYQQAYADGQPHTLNLPYPAGRDQSYYQLTARRSGHLLVVSVADFAELVPALSEQAVREGQAREQAARAALAEQRPLAELLRQVPAAVAVMRGPRHRYSFFNERYQQVAGHRARLGAPMSEAMPETVDQGFVALLDQVYRTGQPYVGTAVAALLRQSDGTLHQRYFDVTYQQLPADADQPEVGILAFALDVTEQVLARKQTETLQAAMLAVSQRRAAEQERQRDELEARVLARTAELNGQKQLLETVLSQTDVSLVLLGGPRHVVELGNARLNDFMGRDMAALYGRPVLEAAPDLQNQGFEELLAGVYQTGQARHLPEVPVQVSPAGQPSRLRYYSVSVVPSHDDQGQVAGVIVTGLDVTAQVRARRQVQYLNQQLATTNEELEQRVAARTAELAAARAEAERQRRQWQRLFERAPAGICILAGPDWVYEYVNPQYQAMSQLALLGRPLLEALPDLKGQPLEQVLRHVYATGETFEGREVLSPLARTAGGTVEDLYFDLTYQARTNDAGEIDGIVAYAQDVTGQVLARQERETQRQLLQRVFEQAPVAVYVMRMPDYVLEVVNPLMAQMLGRPIAELQGHPFLEAVPEVANQGLPERLAQVWQSRQPFYMAEQAFQLAYHPADEPGYYSYVYQPVLEADGRMVALVCVAQDVTEQVLARRQVQQLNEELTAANAGLQASNAQLTRTNADLDTFVYTASHDLKTPITNLEGLLAALHDTLPPAVQQHPDTAPLLALLDGTVERFRQTITQLTDLIRLQQTQGGPAEPVPLAALVEAVRLDLAADIAAAGARLHVAVPPPLHVVFALANLRSIVYNLLSNALKYRDPARPAQVWLRAESQPGAVVLTVTDNGLGLSERQQQRLFQVFQRLHTHVEGTGVGLYMIKRLIENAGGTIAVESRPGIGSTFTVTLPA